MSETATDLRPCGDCGVRPGELHDPGCDVERCPRCGTQAISCDCIYEVNGTDPDRLDEEHPDLDGPTEDMVARWEAEWGHRRLPWSGEWPGVAECREFGWYCRRNPRGPGFVPCTADHPGAVEDLNRLVMEATWDRAAGRFVRPGES